MFTKWFNRKVREAWANAEEGNMPTRVSQYAQTSSVPDEYPDEETIRFELTPAVGGRILRVRRYDRRKDESNSQVYVIPSGEDVGERVAKILNLEMLK